MNAVFQGLQETGAVKDTFLSCKTDLVGPSGTSYKLGRRGKDFLSLYHSAFVFTSMNSQPTSNQASGASNVQCLTKANEVIGILKKDYPNERSLVESIWNATMHCINTDSCVSQLIHMLASMLDSPERIGGIVERHPEIFPSTTAGLNSSANGSVTIIRRDRKRHVIQGGQDEDRYGAVVTVPRGPGEPEKPKSLPDGNYSVSLEEIGGEDVIDDVSTRHFGITVNFTE